MCSTGREKLWMQMIVIPGCIKNKSSGFQILSLFFSFSAYNFPPSSVFIAAGKNTCNYCNNTVKL